MTTTFLFVPAHEPRKVASALRSASDAVILDLEDGVPADRKADARAAVVAQFETMADQATPDVWVRVNTSVDLFEEDVSAVPWSRVAGAVLPKTELTDRVRAIEAAGAGRILLMIESAAGLEKLGAVVAAASRVERLAIGTWDLMLDLGILAVDDPDACDLIWQVRGELVLRSRQLGLLPPVDGIYQRLDDEAGLRAVCTRAARLGFGGKLLVHPRQVPVVRSVFTIADDRLALAREIVEAYEQALTAGRGAVQVRGLMVDAPVVERAHALLRAAGARR
jgi:citrate lyase subunit beta/citryl-CoA lyase